MQAAELLSAFDRAQTTEARVKILERLMALGPEARLALGRMVNALDDPDPSVREWAAEVLARLGPQASAAGPRLLQNARHSAPRVRASSVWAIGEVGYASGAEVVASALRDSHSEVRRWAACALRMIGAHQSVRSLVPLLNDQAPSVRRSAILAMASLATDAEHEPKRAQINAVCISGPVNAETRALALEAILCGLADPDRGVLVETERVLRWFKAFELEGTAQRLNKEALLAERAVDLGTLEARIGAVIARALAG